RSPVFLSSSYLTLDPMGISTKALNSDGEFSPGVTSCHGWIMKFAQAVLHSPAPYAEPECRGRAFIVFAAWPGCQHPPAGSRELPSGWNPGAIRRRPTKK